MAPLVLGQQLVDSASNGTKVPCGEFSQERNMLVRAGMNNLKTEDEGVSLVVGGERRFVSFYATSC